MRNDPDVAVPSVEVDGVLTPAPVRKTNHTMHAAGGVAASITDLGRWLRLNLAQGTIDGVRIVSPQSVREMQTVAAARIVERPLLGRRFTGWGLAWSISEQGGQRVLDHAGGFQGAATSITLLPDLGLGIAVVANGMSLLPELVVADVIDAYLQRERAADLLAPLQQISARMAGSFSPPDLPPSGAVSEHLELAPDRYVGCFKNPDWGTIQLEFSRGTLHGNQGDLPVLLSLHG